MYKRSLFDKSVAAVAAAAFLLSAGAALAAPNPSGSGQPSASCGSPGATVEPNGFSTGGFTHAALVYAGSPGSHSLASNNPKAVSIYDIACYQLTQNHP